MRVCAVEPEVDAGTFTLRPRWGLEQLEQADTVLVPGTSDLAASTRPEVVDALRAAARRGGAPG